MGEGQAGYCGLRWNEAGKLVSVSTPDAGLFYAYRDPHVTNCCAAFFCPAATGLGYPEFAYTPGPEIGYDNLSIFLYGCNFDCLFCQNPSHKDIHGQSPRSADELIEMTLQNDRVSCWCFFGGSPEPQLPFAINASRKVLDRLQGKRLLRICFEWNGCGQPALVKRAAQIACASGGNVKFDLKTWDDNLSMALSGVSNRVAYDNFTMVAREFRPSEQHPPWLCASTLLVPGYVDEVEVEQIARFIAGLDAAIPYSLLVFHPDFMMRDLPITPREQVTRCYETAKKHLTRVHIGNLHLLGEQPGVPLAQHT
jgi:pyruvate formate lyase activating enzyme